MKGDFMANTKLTFLNQQFLSHGNFNRFQCT